MLSLGNLKKKKKTRVYKNVDEFQEILDKGKNYNVRMINIYNLN